MKFKVTGMTCSACASHVEKAVLSVEGVNSVSVSLLTNSMLVEFGPPATAERICSAVSKAGYKAYSEKTDKKALKNDGDESGTGKIALRLTVSVVLLIILMYISMGHVMWNFPLPFEIGKEPMVIAICELLLSALIIIINQRFFISGFKSLLHGSPNMDTLVALGSGASFSYSVAVLFRMCYLEKSEAHHLLHELYFESAAMILVLITVGKLLEAFSKGKTTSAVQSLMYLTPATAHVIRDGVEETINASELAVGDLFAVRPGESIPADGIVRDGISSVNESALTGESVPSDKSPGAKVSAATINLNGSLTCEATHVGGDTTLSRIIEMVETAASEKAPIAKIADKVSGIFVPAVILIAAAVGAVWAFLGKDIGFVLERSVSVLVISCPCALGLATPVAIMVGSGIGAKNGILFKTAAALESTGRTRIAVIDKTGTITEGKPRVTDIVCAKDTDEASLLSAAASLEAKSEHPFASAVSDKAKSEGITPSPVTDFSALPGFGLEASIEGFKAYGGNAVLMKSKGLMTPELEAEGERLAEDGKTPLYFSKGGSLLGIIAVADELKPDSADAISQLRGMGIFTVMLTGDNKRTADAIARRAGTDAVISDVLPNDKESVVKTVGRFGKTVMVGDGINDAPALTRADVGIAIGAGTDIAIDAADVVLIKSTLADVPAAIRLSSQTLKNIRENLFWAFFYNCICIPLAAGAFIPLGITMNPMFGAAAMSLSSICVVTNALRLNLFDIYRQSKKHRADSGLAESVGRAIAEFKGENSLSLKKAVKIDGMMCEHCTAFIKDTLSKLDGVVSVEVSLEAGEAEVTLSKPVDESTLSAPVIEGGYTVVSITDR